MAKYSHDTVVPFKDSDLGKKQQIADMFTVSRSGMTS